MCQLSLLIMQFCRMCICFLVLKAIVVYTGEGDFIFNVYKSDQMFFPFLLPFRRLTSSHLRNLRIAPSTWRRTILLGNILPCQCCVITSRWCPQQTSLSVVVYCLCCCCFYDVGSVWEKEDKQLCIITFRHGVFLVSCAGSYMVAEGRVAVFFIISETSIQKYSGSSHT